MTDRKPPELFAERPVRSDFARPGIPYGVRRLITITVLALIIGGGLYWKFGATPQLPPGEIPTIAAAGAYKHRPDNPGGLDIPNQDVQVYQEIDNKTVSQPGVEHLLPPPEVPTAPPPQPAASAPSPAQLEDLTAKPIPTTAAQPQPAPAPSMAPAPAPVPAVQTAPAVPSPAARPPAAPLPATQAAKPAPEPVAPKPAAKAAAAPKTIDDVLKDVAAQGKAANQAAVQLAAVKGESDAQNMIKHLQAKYGAILGGTQLHIVKANLGAKGVYYRIQSSTMTEDRAKKMCAALKNAKAGCILVHP